MTSANVEELLVWRKPEITRLAVTLDTQITPKVGSNSDGNFPSVFPQDAA
jgi:hypothetical protein